MVLKPFIADANKLYEVCAFQKQELFYACILQCVTMTLRGRKQLVQGGVLFVLADTLAAHSIGGFKVGVGFSPRKCRMCLATKDQLSREI